MVQQYARAGKVRNVLNVEYVHHYLLEWPFWGWCHGDGFSWLARGDGRTNRAIHS